MDVYKAKNHSDGSLDKLKLGIIVRGDFQNKEMIKKQLVSNRINKDAKLFLRIFFQI